MAYNVGLLAASLESNVSKLGADIKDMADEVDVLTVQVFKQIHEMTDLSNRFLPTSIYDNQWRSQKFGLSWGVQSEVFG